MTPAAANIEAHRLAVALGETGAEGQSPLPLVLMQLSRIVRLMGVEWADARVQNAVIDHALAHGSSPRTLGGKFFSLCRDDAYSMIEFGTLTRREFCRTFCVRPREKKDAPVRKSRPQKPNVCKRCREYVGPESQPHNCPAVLPGGGGMASVEGPAAGTAMHTTRGGKGHVGRAIDKQKVPRRKRQTVEAEVYVVRRKTV